MKRILAYFVLFVLGSLFVVYVWPTRWFYLGTKSPPPIYRVDRITGQAYLLRLTGWDALKPSIQDELLAEADAIASAFDAQPAGLFSTAYGEPDQP
ncbi:MAG TPA: hypothetical protein VNA25_28565 [Phycisphaerae bacterium]|nr:hypothetical protein [Phycisphaerae bacterium]